MSEEPNYIFTGTVIHKGEPQTFGNFTKAALVVSDNDPQYEQQVEFDVTGKALEYMDKYDVGDTVTVKFNLRGRAGTGKWEGRWFTNVQAWRVDKADGSGESAPAPEQSAPASDEPGEGVPF